jgi:hypothetical protein
VAVFPTETLALQWIKRAYELGSPSAASLNDNVPDYVEQHSDHLGIMADFNQPFFRCGVRPKDTPGGGGKFGSEPVVWSAALQPGPAQNVTFDGLKTSPPSDSQTRIQFPGSLQWYLITNSGTISIGIAEETPTVDYEVYQAADLSRPVSWYHGETTEWVEKVNTGISTPPVINKYSGKTYAFADPPYYVHVFAVDATGKPNRTWTGPYRISFHLHLCSSPEDRCILLPGKLETYQWPDTFLQPADTIYYALYADTLSNGKSPKASFYLDGIDTALHPFNLVYPEAHQALLTGDGQSLLPWALREEGSHAEPEFGGNTFPHVRLDAPDSMRGEDCGAPFPPPYPQCSKPQRFLLRLKRPDYYQTEPIATYLRYVTSLTYFQARTLECLKEETDVGHDHVFGFFLFDPDLVAPLPCLPDFGCQWIGEFESGDPRRPISQFSGRFETMVVPEIWDADGNDYLALQPQFFVDAPPKASWLSPMSWFEFKPETRVAVLGDKPNGDDSEFWYYLTYDAYKDQVKNK